MDGRPVVLRRPPSGPLPPGAHDMVREHRILSRLWRAFSLAPRSLHLCTDAGVIGVPFQLLEYRHGAVIRGNVLPEFARSREACRAIASMMIETLGAIHAVDADAVGLGDLGKPAGFYERAVEGWAGRADHVARTDSLRSACQETAAWLRAHRPAARPATLLHCDFKLDNCILDPATLRPVAVVDWDMGTRGDPLFDLATLMSYWAEPGDPPCMHRLAQMPTLADGFGTRADAVAAYAQQTGRDVGDFPPFRVLALFKLGVVFLQLHDRWLNGAVRGPQYVAFEALGAELVEYALAVARGGSA